MDEEENTMTASVEEQDPHTTTDHTLESPDPDELLEEATGASRVEEQDPHTTAHSTPESPKPDEPEKEAVPSSPQPPAEPLPPAEPQQPAPTPVPEPEPEPEPPLSHQDPMTVDEPSESPPTQDETQDQMVDKVSSLDPSPIKATMSTEEDSPSKPSAIPSPTTTRQELMQEVMKDKSLTPKERQQKIQEILRNSTASPPAENSMEEAISQDSAKEKSDDFAEKSGPSNVAGLPQARVGAVASQGEDPAARKGSRRTSAMAPISAVMAADNSPSSPGRGFAEPSPPPTSLGAVGAVSSSGVDLAAAKGARQSSTTRLAAAAEQTESTEPDPLPSQRVGASSMSGRTTDPAGRKSARASASASSRASAPNANMSPGKAHSPVVGALSRRDNPTVAKSLRGSNRGAGLMQPPLVRGEAAGTSTASMAATPGGDASSRALAPNSPAGARSPIVGASRRRDNPTVAKSMRGSNRGSGLMQPPLERGDATGTTSTAASLPVTPGGNDATRGDMQPLLAPSTQARQPPPQRPHGNTQLRSGPRLAPALPTTRENSIPDHALLLNPPISQPPPPQPRAPLRSPPNPTPRETYAGVGLTGPDIAGVDTGGFQAYVAEPEGVVVGATAVAVDLDNEEKERREQVRCVRLGIAVFCVLLVAVIVPVAIVAPGGKDGPPIVINITDSPTTAPTASPTGSTYATLLETLSNLYSNDTMYEEAFSSQETPQAKAADWAANLAPLGLDGDDPRMISRYALATFYFATNGDDWERCGVSSTNCDTEQEWLTSEDECSWLAVACDDNHNVLDLFFQPIGTSGNNIVGSLPFDVALLSSLQRLVLSLQGLTGEIPRSWSRLSTLQTVFLGGNDLTGTFPDFLLAQNTLLGTLFLGENNLSGPLSPLSSTSLASLRFEDNMITGQLPDLDLPQLTELYAETNQLSGTIPDSLFSITSLRTLRLSNNMDLAGTLSQSIGNLQALEQLRIANTTVGGTLPSSFYTLTKLNRVELSGCSFSGPIPDEFGSLTNASIVLLSNNSFTGTFPSSAFDELGSLRQLELHGNMFTGSVSAALCNRTGTTFFDIGILTADCAGDPPEVVCDCCTCF